MRVFGIVIMVAVAGVFRHPIQINTRSTTVIEKVAPTLPSYMPRAVCLSLRDGDSLRALRKKYRYTKEHWYSTTEFKIAENHHQHCTIDTYGKDHIDLVGLWVV